MQSIYSFLIRTTLDFTSIRILMESPISLSKSIIMIANRITYLMLWIDYDYCDKTRIIIIYNKSILICKLVSIIWERNINKDITIKGMTHANINVSKSNKTLMWFIWLINNQFRNYCSKYSTSSFLSENKINFIGYN